jgi:predicted ATPase/DNA-binding winged helix-turn-helix (wHTH) protein
VPEANPKLVYATGQWAIDLGRRELRSRGVPVPLGSRAFEIVTVLVEAATELVTKDDLMERVWPGAIVGENTLHVHISAVRKALGSDRRMLKTEAGRGYRLIGGWMIRQDGEAAEPAALEPTDTLAQPLVTNFPAATSTLIGRTEAVQQLRDLLSAYRIVTLTGPGGIGKTVLALEVARSLLPTLQGDGWLVELASLSDPELVPSAVAGILGVKLGGDEISAEAIARAIGGKRLLLVLDNCEHLVHAAARLVETLVRFSPHTTVLATSREALRIEGEHLYRVPPLDVPPDDQDEPGVLLGHSAVELFVAKTGALGSDFSPHGDNLVAVAAICRRLDGIPLAIEFAAARTAMLGVQQVAAHLDDRFGLLAGGRRTALPRHQTLRATLDWSYDLLPEIEQLLLRRLAVFAGGFSLEAAATVAASGELTRSSVVDCVARLVEKSLVATNVGHPEARCRLLETTRAYALKKLTEDGEYQDVARRHAEYFLDLLERATSEESTRSITDWLSVYGREVDDVRAALDWAFSPSGDATIGVTLTIASEPLWFGLSLMDECRRRVEHALASLQSDERGGTRREMRLYATLAGALYYTKGPAPEVCATWTDVLQIAERLDDAEYIRRALWGLWFYRTLNSECQVAVALARRLANLPPSQAAPNDRLVGERMLGTSLHYLGDLTNARRHLENMLSLYTAPTPQPHINVIRFHYDQRVAGRGTLARILWLQGLPDQAMRMSQDNVENARAIDHLPSLSIALDFACMVVLEVGDLATAERYIAMPLERSAKHALGFWRKWGHSLEGQLLIKRGDVVAGVQGLRAALYEMPEMGFVRKRPALLGALAEGLARIGKVAEGLSAIDEALARCEQTDERWNLAELLRIRGELLLLENTKQATAAAEEHFRRGLDVAHQQGALSWELRCATGLARLWRDQARRKESRELLATVYGRFTEGFATTDLRAAKALIDTLS